mmetsp:Transcript_13265/g.29014  ORF Transcript_13265/g.29014 Transcript_13265/m.29014 type:complete len:96 (-) Transcript_13265:81-368(-)
MTKCVCQLTLLEADADPNATTNEVHVDSQPRFLIGVSSPVQRRWGLQKTNPCSSDVWPAQWHATVVTHHQQPCIIARIQDVVWTVPSETKCTFSV